MGKKQPARCHILPQLLQKLHRHAGHNAGQEGGSSQWPKATYLRRGTEEDITAAIAKVKRKSFKRRGKEYQRLSSHIGLLPLVMVSPATWS